MTMFSASVSSSTVNWLKLRTTAAPRRLRLPRLSDWSANSGMPTRGTPWYTASYKPLVPPWVTNALVFGWPVRGITGLLLWRDSVPSESNKYSFCSDWSGNLQFQSQEEETRAFLSFILKCCGLIIYWFRKKKKSFKNRVRFLPSRSFWGIQSQSFVFAAKGWGVSPLYLQITWTQTQVLNILNLW